MAVNTSVELDFKMPADKALEVFTKNFEDIDYEVTIEDEDPAKRQVRKNTISSAMLRTYKTYKVTATITPKDDNGDSCRVKWTTEMGRITDDIENTESETVHFYRKSPAEDLFKAFMEAVKDDEEVAIEAVDWENTKTTIKLLGTGLLLRSYKTLEVTIVVTPTSGHGSHVKCDVMLEKRPSFIEDPLLPIVTATYFLNNIEEKLLD